MKYLFFFLILITSDFINAQTVTRRATVLGCEGDCQNGYGMINYENGDIYKGNFKNYKQHGFGIYKWHTGDSYSGNWENGTKHGYGELTWSSGTIWKGEWRNGEKYKGKTYWNEKGSSSTSTSKTNISKTTLDKDLEDELRGKYSNIATSQLNKIDAFPDKWSKYYNEKLKEIDANKAEELRELTNQKSKISEEILNLKRIRNLEYSQQKRENKNRLDNNAFKVIEKNRKTNELIQKITATNTNILISSDLSFYICVPKNEPIYKERIIDKWEKKQIKKFSKAGYIYIPNYTERKEIISSFTYDGNNAYSNYQLIKNKKSKYSQLKTEIKILNARTLASKSEYQKCLDYIDDRERQWNIQRYRAELREQKLEEERKEKERLERERKAEEEREKSNSYATNEQNYSRGNYKKKRINVSDIDISKYVRSKTFRRGNFKVNFHSNGWVILKIDRGSYYGTEMKGLWNRYGSNALQITKLSFTYGHFDASNNPDQNGIFYLQRDGSLSGEIGDYTYRREWIFVPQ